MKKKSKRKLAAKRELAKLKAENELLKAYILAQEPKPASSTHGYYGSFTGLLSQMNTNSMREKVWIN